MSETQETEVISPEPSFVEQVQQALDHLYDFPFLQHHPLAQQIESAEGLPAETAGQRLRRELIAAIESLSPEPGVSFRASVGRVYSMLQLRYVEGLTVLEAARQLSISPRQAHRELRRGEESVAELLRARLGSPANQPGEEERQSSVQAEIARLGNTVGTTDLRELLSHALKAIDKMAHARSVTLDIPLPEFPVIISADPIVAQQVLTSLLSYLVKQAQPGALRVDVAPHADMVQLIAPLAGPTSSGASAELDPIIAQLAGRLDWQVVLRDDDSTSEHCRVLALSMPVTCRTVLVIDDNEGLVALIERYLISVACRVVKAGSGLDGLRLAQEVEPDAIILDIMLPKVDGWEVLQTLRSDPRTSHIPVIVCSVIRDPELAESLGASMLLKKPVSRDDLLGALKRVGVM